MVYEETFDLITNERVNSDYVFFLTDQIGLTKKTHEPKHFKWIQISEVAESVSVKHKTSRVKSTWYILRS